MPCGTILKTVQKSPIYIFVNKFPSLNTLLPVKNSVKESKVREGK